MTEEKENLIFSLYQKKLIYNLYKSKNIIIPGIYIISKPLIINEKECLIITLEGLDKFNENLLFAHQLRNVILILSSLVIYEGNDNIEITKQNFNNIFKQIKVIKSSNLKKDLTKDYMSRLLCEINIPNEDENNNTNINKFNNEVLSKKLFKQFEIINKYNKSQKSLNYKLKWIKDNFDIKRLNKIELDGNMICDLMENMCEKFNIDEVPVIDILLENILLSKMNQIAENIITQFKNKLKNYIKESQNQNQNQSFNYYDLISFYYNFHKNEGISNLCKSKISTLIQLPNAEPYIKKIISTTFEEVDVIYKNHKTKYEELVKNFGIKMFNKKEPKNIQEIKDFFNNMSKYLKKNFIPIISYKMFNFENTLYSKVNDYIINKLNYIVKPIKDILENEKQAIIAKNNEEKNKIIEEKINKELELQNSIRDIKNKEKEYITALEIEKKKYKNLENYLETFENENQKMINDLEMKLNELIKDNNNLKNKKLISNEDVSLNSVKSDFIYVKNKLIEYKTYIDNYNNQININYQSNAIDKGIKIINTKFDDWFSNLEQVIINNFNNVNDNEEKINKIDNLNFEITKLKIELTKEQQNNLVLKTQLEEEKKKLEGLQSLLEERVSLIKVQEERINIQLKDIDNYKKNKEQLEVDLNKNIIKYKLKEEENEVLLSVFYSVLSKKKDKYENNIKKLSSDVMQEIERLNKQFIFFK